MQRIETTFQKLKGKRAALIPFIMGFDPDKKTTLALLEAMPAAGADIIEIGMPFSDPMADGKTIQAAGLRALKSGATVAGVLGIVKEFRAKNNDTPIILMGYYNPIYRYDCEKFCKDAAASGVDGLILVDLPPEEEHEITGFLKQNKLHLVRLIAPTSNGDRLKLLCNSASGFVYYISVAGITGDKSANMAELDRRLIEVKSYTSLPIAVGFGIKNAAQVKQIAPFANAVVVGSALVDAIDKSSDKVATATKFIKELAAGLK